MSIVCSYFRFDLLAVSAALIISASVPTTISLHWHHQYWSHSRASSVAAYEGHYRKSRILAADAMRLRNDLRVDQNKSAADARTTRIDEIADTDLV